MTRVEPPVLVITGPTTSGKTGLSVAVADRLDGEIVSMDSRQVYRGMDVGTDKVALRDRARVRHHGLDLVDPGQRYSAGRFARDAGGWIDEIHARGRVAVLAGGTGFFLSALMTPLFEEPELDPGRREALRAHLSAWDRSKLARAVRVLDPGRAHLAEAGGPQRMLRTLEVALLTGRPLSDWHRDQPDDRAVSPVRNFVIVLLDLPRECLDRRIDARVERMRSAGLVDEVARLLEAGYDARSPSMSGTGYREIAEHLRGRMTLEDALEAMKVQTRQYARRQLTWFRGQLPDGVTRIDATTSLAAQADAVTRAWIQASGKTPGPAGAGEEPS